MVGLPGNDGRLPSKEVWRDLQEERGVRHLMVEGGPATAKSFLDDGLVDRAIFVYAPIEFKEPAPSGLFKSSFEDAGLELLGEGALGSDRVEYWSRPCLNWPTSELSEWP